MDYMLFVCRHHIALIGCGREEGEVRMILSGKGKGRCLSGQTSFYYCIYSFTESSLTRHRNPVYFRKTSDDFRMRAFHIIGSERKKSGHGHNGGLLILMTAKHSVNRWFLVTKVKNLSISEL